MTGASPKKGPEWDHVIIVEQKKEIPRVQCKFRVEQILSNSKCATRLALRLRKSPGLVQITLNIIEHVSFTARKERD
jgi:hypothetical protein